MTITRTTLRPTIALVALALATSLLGAGPSSAAPDALGRPALRPFIGDQDALATAYQMNSHHEGTAMTTGLTPPLTLQWSLPFGGPISYPLIANNKVYVVVADNGTVGTNLYALDKYTGATVWQKNIRGFTPWAGLAYDKSRVFVLNDRGELSGYNADTGTKIFKVTLSTSQIFSSPPTARQDLVYMSGADQTGGTGTLYAVHETDGHIRWSAPVADGSLTSPIISHEWAFATYACNQTYAFDRRAGTLLWTWSDTPTCTTTGGRTPVFDNFRLYLRDPATSPPGWIIDATTGQTVYGRFFSTTTPAFAGDLVMNFYNGNLQGKNWKTGQVLWTFTGDGLLTTAPIVINGTTVFIGSGSGEIYMLDRTTGAVLWSDNVGVPIPAPQEGSTAQPLTGLAAAQGILVVPAGSVLSVYAS